MPPERYGDYRVFEQLGQGGMATVHRAEIDTPQGVKHVALKRLTPTIDRKPVTLFLDEARLLRYLHHPNIPETFDSGRVFGTYFIAMEYIEGRTVKDLVEQCAAAAGPVPQAVALNLIAQLCDALDYAHKRCDEKGRPLGIIHRDVTPANLILCRTGLLKLVDFGLAKATLATEPSTAGVIKGKLGYVAPEYTRGKIDHRADLWAVGIIMYELLTGRRLFHGANDFQTITRVRELPIPRPSLANPKVTPDVDEVVMTALMRDPRRRWPSAAALRDRIHQVAAQHQPMDNQKVSEWVTWALAQKRGTRAPQITPVVPMPVRTTETTEPMERMPDMISLSPSRRSVVWTVCACVLGLLALVALAWKLVR
jgi:serine/threonine protein kinase